jgi:hypothetical protein
MPPSERETLIGAAPPPGGVGAPPPPAAPPSGPTPPVQILPPGARCAKHPDRDAVGTCARCGNFTCSLCSVPLLQGRHCPECAERVRAEDRRTPWDERKTRGFWPAFKETTRQVLFEPSTFFSKMPRSGGFESPILFVIVVHIAQAFLMVGFLWIGALFGLQFAGGFGGNTQIPWGQLVTQVVVQSIQQVICAPVGAIISAFVGGAILHVGLMVFGAAKYSYETTVRVYAFAQAAAALMLVILPLGLVAAGIGALAAGGSGAAIVGGGVFVFSSLIVSIWSIAIEVIGIREAHETTTGKALGAVLLPVICVFCCVGIVAGLLVTTLRLQNP